MEFSQDSRFTGGMGQGLSDLNQPVPKYRKAVNMSHAEWGNLTTLARVKSDVLKGWGAAEPSKPSSLFYIDAFEFEFPSEVPEPAILVFAEIHNDEEPIRGAIYMYLPRYEFMALLFDPFLNNYNIYTRCDYPAISRDSDIDCRIYREGTVAYAIFSVSSSFGTGSTDRPYCLPIPGGPIDVVNHNWGYKLAPYMGIAHNTDCLYLQEIVPQAAIAPTVNTGTRNGNLLCGSYQFGFRYVNTVSGKTSRISLLTHPIPVVPTIENGSSTSLRGGGPGEIAASSIELNFISTGYHKNYFNAVQLFVVEWIGSAPPVVKMLDPEVINAAHYTPGGGPMVKEYTGNEAHQLFTIEELLEVRANIESAVSLEERDGRLFLFNLKYSKLESGLTWQNNVYDASTVVEQLSSISIDPLTSNSDRYGFQDAFNTVFAKGYRGSEVYRFGVCYFNKFGEVTLPDRIKFNEVRYNPAQHTTTWTQNWAAPGCFDWKFPDRSSSQTSAMSLNSVNSFGIQFGIGGCPGDAFGAIVVRRKRIKNILASTPVIPAMSVMGGYAHIDGKIADGAELVERPWLAPGNYDCPADQNTYEPKVLAYGALQHLRLSSFPGVQNPAKRLFFPQWRKASVKNFDSITQYPGGTSNSLLYLYPPELLANDNGEPFSLKDMAGTRLEVTDCVMTASYNCLRDGAVLPGAVTSAMVKNGKVAKYGWVYAPLDGRAYWSVNNPTSKKITNRVSPTDGTLGTCAPPFVSVGKSWIIGQSSLKTEIPQGFSQEEPESSISNANGLYDLWVAQSKNEYSIFKNSGYRYPGFIQNQRALLVSQDVSAASPFSTEMIQDPSWAIKNYYIDGAGSFASMFPGQPEPSADSITDAASPTSIANLAFTENPLIIDPGSGVPVFIANITKGIPDNRYGEDSYEEWIPTGTVLYIGSAELEQLVGAEPSPIPVIVFGGDTFISSFAIKIRDNAPLIHTVPVQDTTDTNGVEKFFQYQGVYGDKTTDPYGEKIGRVSGYEAFFEILHIHLEAEVNGHYIFRAQDDYPSGITSRNPTAANDPVAFPSYLDTENIQAQLSGSFTYLYNFGYSQGLDVETFFSRKTSQRIESHAFSRIHYTPQRVPGQFSFPFQRWLTGDYHDLQRSSGLGSRLYKVADDRMVALQDNDVVLLSMGLAMVEDSDGQALAIQSARVIGSDNSISSGTSSSFAAGARRLKHSVATPFGVFFLDHNRHSMCVVGGGRVNDLSTIELKEELAKFFFDVDDVDNQLDLLFSVMYEPRSRRVWFTRRDREPNPTTGLIQWRAVTYLPMLGQWESFWDNKGTGFLDVVAFAGTDRAVIGFSNESPSGDVPGRIYAREAADTDWGSFFGHRPDSTVTFILNNTEHTAIPKVIKTVQVQGDGEPAGVQAGVVRRGTLGLYEQLSEEIPASHERRGTFLFNLFHRLNEPGTRVFGEQIEVTVRYSGTGPGYLESAHTTYRILHRTRKR